MREAVPPGQLLVFETGKDGFEELARFLGVTAPAGAPYPHANSAAEFAFVINIQRALALATVLTVAVAVRFAVRCLPGQGGATRQKREKKELCDITHSERKTREDDSDYSDTDDGIDYNLTNNKVFSSFDRRLKAGSS